MDQISFHDINELIGDQIGKYDVACPVCGPGRTSPLNRKRPVLRIYREEKNFATYNCVRCGLNGWAQQNRSLPFGLSKKTRLKKETFKRCSEQGVAERKQKARQLEYVLKLWEQMQPATSTLAQVNLEKRALPGPYSANIRFLGNHKHCPTNSWWPVCVFGLSLDPSGDIVALQRVYLQRDGSSKAPIKPAKMSLGSIRGAAVWFGEPDETLVIVEGPEDGMTCHLAGYFTAAACGAFNLKNLTIPAIVQKIIIGADHGEAGEKAAKKAAQTYLQQGYEVFVAFPPAGHDWNSYWLVSSREVAV